MNERDYQNAVRQIQWPEAKRRKIEEILSAAPQSDKSSEDAWKESHVNPRVAVSHSSAKRTEVFEMKQKKSRRILFAGVAAAVLATCGAVAGIAAFSQKKMHTIDVTHKSGTVLHLTDEENVPFFTSVYGFLADDIYNQSYPHSSKNFDCRGMITAADTGWFYRQPRVLDTSNDTYYNKATACDYVLMYADKETGESVPVCAKPNCKHDGSDSCVASTRVYAPSFMEYHDGYLYTLTTKFLHPEERKHPEMCWEGDSSVAGDIKSEDCRQVLLRYSPDGTEIKELYDFGSGKGVSKCLFHRGYLWCLVQLQKTGEDINHEVTGDASQFISGGWQLWGYELATGKAVCLYDARPDEKYDQVNNLPRFFTAGGDYLYFCRKLVDWSGSMDSLQRISLLDGQESTAVEYPCFRDGVSQKFALWQSKPKNNMIYDGIFDLEASERIKPDENAEEEIETYNGRKIQYGLSGLVDNRFEYQHCYTVDEETKEFVDSMIGVFDIRGDFHKFIKLENTPQGIPFFMDPNDGFMPSDALSGDMEDDTDFMRKNSYLFGVCQDNIYVMNYCDGFMKALKNAADENLFELKYCSYEDLETQDEPEMKLAFSYRLGDL